MKVVQFRTKAFTFLESLCVLAIVSFLLSVFSGQVKQTFQRIEEELFVLSFEQFYRHTQKMSVCQHRSNQLQFKKGYLSNGKNHLYVPKRVTMQAPDVLVFDKSGGNSSLANISFYLSSKKVSYQLYIGSGNYKKTESKSVYSTR